MPARFERARAVALRALARSAQSRAALRARLERAGLAAEAPETLAWLAELGYLDDAAYARARAGALLARGRVGPALAERRLGAEGLAGELAREAVRAALAERVAGAESGREARAELALCEEAARRKLGGKEPAALDRGARGRLARFLLGRGFSSAAVTRVAALEEEPSD